MEILGLNKIINIVILVTVLFFSSGFTAIVKYCSMSQSSECCCDTEKSPSQKYGVTVSDPNPSCLIVKTIGGLSDIKATVNSETIAETLSIVLVEFIPNVISVPSVVHTLHLFFADGMALPNEEIYIRINSLLI